MLLQWMLSAFITLKRLTTTLIFIRTWFDSKVSNHLTFSRTWFPYKWRYIKPKQLWDVQIRKKIGSSRCQFLLNVILSSLITKNSWTVSLDQWFSTGVPWFYVISSASYQFYWPLDLIQHLGVTPNFDIADQGFCKAKNWLRNTALDKS